MTPITTSRESDTVMNIVDRYLRPRFARTGWLTLLRLFMLFALLLTLPRFALALQITDQEGEVITFSKPFCRIISLYPAHTENLVGLGLTGEIIGISTSDNYPDSITGKPRFNDADNAEKFIAAAPDLLLIRPMIARTHPDLIKRLRQSGITVVSLQPTTVEHMFTSWPTLGQLTGKAEAAGAMKGQFQAGIKAIQQKIPQLPTGRRPGVYFEAIHSKMKTFSPKAIAIFALEAAGGRNIASDATARNESNIAEYGKERILAKSGEIEVFLSQQGRMNKIDIEILRQEPGFQIIKAFKEDRVHLIDETQISRPTLRLLLGIEEIAKILYPSR